jgi:hypothetical protein
LTSRFGANVRLYDGNDVLTIDKSAALHQAEVVRGLSGLLLELQNNRTRIILLSDVLGRRMVGRAIASRPIASGMTVLVPTFRTSASPMISTRRSLQNIPIQLGE